MQFEMAITLSKKLQKGTKNMYNIPVTFVQSFRLIAQDYRTGMYKLFLGATDVVQMDRQTNGRE